MKRGIIEIDEEKCNGCGKCIPNCPEGALQIIDGKARLVSSVFCDGLGACIGHCPKGAISIVEKDVEKYDERRVMQNIAKQGANTIRAHLLHLKDHGQTKYFNEAVAFLKEKKIPNPLEEKKQALPCGCPGSAARTIAKKSSSKTVSSQASELRQWPIQLNLLSPQADYFDNSELLVSADCVAHAFPNFHPKLLKGKTLVIGCPKLDDIEGYAEKLSQIFKFNRIKKVTVAIMEVPCCRGMSMAVQEALEKSGKKIPFEEKIVSIGGQML